MDDECGRWRDRWETLKGRVERANPVQADITFHDDIDAGYSVEVEGLVVRTGRDYAADGDTSRSRRGNAPEQFDSVRRAPEFRFFLVDGLTETV